LRQHHYWSRELLALDTACVGGFPFCGIALPKLAADWLVPWGPRDLAALGAEWRAANWARA